MATPVTVLDRSETVAAALPPIRRRMIELLVDPQSASSLARALDLPRQKLNYHLRELERHGLVQLVDSGRGGSVACSSLSCLRRAGLHRP